MVQVIYGDFVCVCVCFSSPGRGADRTLRNQVPWVLIDLKAMLLENINR